MSDENDPVVVESETIDGQIESQAPAVAQRDTGAVALMSITESRAQVNHIQHLMKQVMKEGTHWGTVPGCGPKPTLLKPGAEKLSLVFRLGARLKIKRLDLANGHREFTIITELFHIPTGNFIGEGVGSCSTMESKYRYRKGGIKCPNCGEPTIKVSQYGKGGYYCATNMGGCNEKFQFGNPQIEKQDPSGRIENPDIADTYNTVLKMAKKRSQIDAILSATAASDIFTQDVEDLESARDADDSMGITKPDNGQNRKADRAPHTIKQRKANKARPKVAPEAKGLQTIVKKMKTRIDKTGSYAGVQRWGILISEGIWLNTFDENLADVAKEGQIGVLISYHYDDGGSCYMLDDIELSPDIPDEDMTKQEEDGAFG